MYSVVQIYRYCVTQYLLHLTLFDPKVVTFESPNFKANQRSKKINAKCNFNFI